MKFKHSLHNPIRLKEKKWKTQFIISTKKKDRLFDIIDVLILEYIIWLNLYT